MNRLTKISAVVVTCLCVGYFASIITKPNIEAWYQYIEKPFFTPPNWLFAPVWTLLYCMMGVAAGLVWDKIDNNREIIKKALIVFGVQLALNAAWSFIFFGLHNPLLGLLEIIVLLLMIYETYTQFTKINKIAGYLLIPYLIWVSYATVLTASIWWLNR